MPYWEVSTFIIYLKRCKNAEHWDDLQRLWKVAEYHVWPSLLNVLSRRTPSSPGAALAKGSGIWAWGREAKLCLGTLHSPSFQVINFYFSRLQFVIHFLLSLVCWKHSRDAKEGAWDWETGGLLPASPEKLVEPIWSWGGNVIPWGISSLICSNGGWIHESVNWWRFWRWQNAFEEGTKHQSF